MSHDILTPYFVWVCKRSAKIWIFTLQFPVLLSVLRRPGGQCVGLVNTSDYGADNHTARELVDLMFTHIHLKSINSHNRENMTSDRCSMRIAYESFASAYEWFTNGPVIGLLASYHLYYVHCTLYMSNDVNKHVQEQYNKNSTYKDVARI